MQHQTDHPPRSFPTSQRGHALGHRGKTARNTSDTERVTSMVLGGLLAAGGATLATKGRSPVGGAALGVAGLLVASHGLAKHNPVLGLLDVRGDDADATSHPLNRAVHVEECVTIDAGAEELYRFWRDLSNIPRVVRYVRSVVEHGDGRSTWRVDSPFGGSVEWEANITADQPGRNVAWESVEGAAVSNEGGVSFTSATGGRGTVVRVTMRYRPLGGVLTTALAKALGHEPHQTVKQGLRQLKQAFEAGEVASVEHNPQGSC